MPVLSITNILPATVFTFCEISLLITLSLPESAGKVNATAFYVQLSSSNSVEKKYLIRFRPIGSFVFSYIIFKCVDIHLSLSKFYPFRPRQSWPDEANAIIFFHLYAHWTLLRFAIRWCALFDYNACGLMLQ